MNMNNLLFFICFHNNPYSPLLYKKRDEYKIEREITGKRVGEWDQNDRQRHKFQLNTKKFFYYCWIIHESLLPSLLPLYKQTHKKK